MSDTERAAPANWFVDPDDPKQLRYWDGTAWTDQRKPNDNYVAPGSVSESSDPPVAKGSNVLGLVGMILAIIGFAFALVAPIAIVAWLFTLPAIVLSIIGLTRKGKRKKAALAGAIISTVAFLLAIITFSVYSVSTTSSVVSSASPSTQPLSAPPSKAASTPKPSRSSTPKPSAPASGFDAAAYASLSDHDFALLVKDPAASKGKKYVIYGVVTQFDAATGKCAFLSNTSNADQASSYSFGQNTLIDASNSCPLVSNVVQGDHVQMWVIDQGAYSYDTQAGGNTTVPRFELKKIMELPALQ